jgi:hypothetical protein
VEQKGALPDFYFFLFFLIFLTEIFMHPPPPPAASIVGPGGKSKDQKNRTNRLSMILTLFSISPQHFT